MKPWRLIMALVLALSAGARAEESYVAHEWGTFTMIAGEDGAALEWRPLAGEDDLPGFVYDLLGKID